MDKSNSSINNKTNNKPINCLNPLARVLDEIYWVVKMLQSNQPKDLATHFTHGYKCFNENYFSLLQSPEEEKEKTKNRFVISIEKCIYFMF